MFDLGQRIAPGGDETKLSMQLTNVFASTNVVAAVLPNPPKSPYVYTVAGHQAKITSFEVNSGDSNTLERDTEFDVTVKVDASTVNDIKLKQKFGNEPLSRPKFYYGGVDGPDRSYEFTSIFSHVQSNMQATRFDPFNKDSNGERKFVYNVKRIRYTPKVITTLILMCIMKWMIPILLRKRKLCCLAQRALIKIINRQWSYIMDKQRTINYP